MFRREEGQKFFMAFLHGKFLNLNFLNRNIVSGSHLMHISAPQKKNFSRFFETQTSKKKNDKECIIHELFL